MICEIALVLLMDASSSLSDRNWQQQTHYTAEAIRSEEVLSAIERTDGVAIMAVEFSSQQRNLMEWTVLRTRQQAIDFANELERKTRTDTFMTDIGGAVRHSIDQFNNVPCEATSQIIDISTDGVDANLRFMGSQRDHAQQLGIRINAIGVGPELQMDDLREYVVTSDGFAVEALSWEQYPLRFRRKIILELTAQ